MADTQLFINGEWTDAKSGESFPTFAPSTGEKIADVAKAGSQGPTASDGGAEVYLYYQPKQRSAAKAVTLQVTEAQASM